MRRDRARLRPWLLALAAAAVVLVSGGMDALALGSANGLNDQPRWRNRLASPFVGSVTSFESV